MPNIEPHKHILVRVAVKQVVDHDVMVQHLDGYRERDYSGPPVPPVILKMKCSVPKCTYSYAYDLMDRKTFDEQREKAAVHNLPK